MRGAIGIAAVRARVGVVAVLLSGALAPAAAWAHGRAVPVRDLAAAPAPSADELLLASLAAVIALGLGGRRRLAVALAIVLAGLGFEIGLHSTHHLADPVRAAACVVAGVTVHLSGTPVDAPGLDPTVTRAPDPAPPAPRGHGLRHRAAPHEGRAPPAPVA
jgi:hypothetical protein